jgi:hypothetical protein
MRDLLTSMDGRVTNKRGSKYFSLTKKKKKKKKKKKPWYIGYLARCCDGTITPLAFTSSDLIESADFDMIAKCFQAYVCVIQGFRGHLSLPRVCVFGSSTTMALHWETRCVRI